jgi:hypothetical protein
MCRKSEEGGLKMKPESKRVAIKWPRGWPVPDEYMWACSFCGLVYERQTDAQNCHAREKYELGIRWRSVAEAIIQDSPKGKICDNRKYWTRFEDGAKIPIAKKPR